MKLLLAFALCFGVASVDAAMRDSEGRNAAGNRREDADHGNMNRFGVPVGRGDDRNDRNNGNDNNECSLNTVYINTQAVVVLVPAAGNVTGTINLYQTDGQGPVTVNGTVYGLGSNGRYGIHIHEYGNLGNGCNSAGQHFNPDGYPHGDLSDPVRHAGDLGNIVSDVDGTATFTLQSNAFSINGDYDVVGRAFVIDAQADDLGRRSASRTSGYISRLACGIIGVGVEQVYNNSVQQTNMNAQG